MNTKKHGRFPLFQSPSKPGGNATTIPGSTNLGTYDTGGYSRFTGLFSTVGSMTLRYQMGVYSGNYQVTSSIVINSGATIFDQLCYGRFTTLP